jgi:hypothetical protein
MGPAGALRYGKPCNPPRAVAACYRVSLRSSRRRSFGRPSPNARMVPRKANAPEKTATRSVRTRGASPYARGRSLGATPPRWGKGGGDKPLARRYAPDERPAPPLPPVSQPHKPTSAAAAFQPSGSQSRRPYG